MVIDFLKFFYGLLKGGIVVLLLGIKRKVVVFDGEEEDEFNKWLVIGFVLIMVDIVDGFELVIFILFV